MQIGERAIRRTEQRHAIIVEFLPMKITDRRHTANFGQIA